MPGTRANNLLISVAPLRRKQRRSFGILVHSRSLPFTSLLRLQKRFGGVRQADKYRMGVKRRRRKAGEPLRTLHSDIRRLTALAFPDIDYTARERIACDYFVDALDEPEFALRAVSEHLKT